MFTFLIGAIAGSFAAFSVFAMMDISGRLSDQEEAELRKRKKPDAGGEQQ